MKKNYLKDNWVYLLFIIGVHSIYLLPLLKHPFYLSHDGTDHLFRAGALIRAFRDSHIPPRWAGNLNWGYGSPVLIFFYPLPGYIMSIFYLVGFSLQDAYKLLISIAFIFAPVTFYIWISKKTNKLSATLSSLIYGLAPYHFLNIYVRGDIGEILFLSLIPLVFLYIDKTEEPIKIKDVLFGGLIFGFVMLSHNGLSLIFSPVILAYIILQTIKIRKVLLQKIIMIFTGLGISAYFWIPALFEQKFTHSNLFIGDMYKEHFPKITQLIYSTWGFGDYVNKPQGLSPQIGVISIILVVSSLLLLVYPSFAGLQPEGLSKQQPKAGYTDANLSIRGIISKKKSLSNIYWAVVFFIAVFFSLPVSMAFWDFLPFMKMLQFPWRFTALSSFAAALVAFPILDIIRKNPILTIIFIGCILFSSISYARINRPINNSNDYYFSNQTSTCFHGEASTIWTAGDPSEMPKDYTDIVSGYGKIQNISRTTINHKYIVDASTNLQIVDNTIYFPGWRVYIDGLKQQIEFQDPFYRGLVKFSVPKGTHEIEVSFHESKVRLFADYISLISIIIITTYLISNILKYSKL